MLVGLHRQDGSERGDQQTQQKQHIHRVPLSWCQRGPVWVIGRRSSANMASILALISAVLIAPVRRTGVREGIEDVGIIEAVVMRALPSHRVRGLGTPGWCAPPSQ